jgi:hypothetical protein
MTSQLLFHQHPTKRVAESVGLIMDLICCSGQVRLRTWHLDVAVMAHMTCGVMEAVLTIRIFGGRSDMLTRTRGRRGMKLCNSD